MVQRERCLRSVQGQEVEATVHREECSALLLEDKKYKMIIDVRSVTCENGAGEDVEHLLVTCREFEKDGD